jgi:hypothetical protein
LPQKTRRCSSAATPAGGRGTRSTHGLPSAARAPCARGLRGCRGRLQHPSGLHVATMQPAAACPPLARVLAARGQPRPAPPTTPSHAGCQRCKGRPGTLAHASWACRRRGAGGCGAHPRGTARGPSHRRRWSHVPPQRGETCLQAEQGRGWAVAAGVRRTPGSSPPREQPALTCTHKDLHACLVLGKPKRAFLAPKRATRGGARLKAGAAEQLARARAAAAARCRLSPSGPGLTP